MSSPRAAYCYPEFRLANNICSIEIPDHQPPVAGRYAKGFSNMHGPQFSSRVSIGVATDAWNTGVFEPKAFANPKPSVDTRPKLLNNCDASTTDQQHTDRPMTSTTCGFDQEVIVDSLRSYLEEWGRQQERVFKNALDEIVHIASNMPAGGGRDNRRRRTRGLPSKDLTGIFDRGISQGEKASEDDARSPSKEEVNRTPTHNIRPKGLPLPRSGSLLSLAMAVDDIGGDATKTPSEASPTNRAMVDPSFGNSLALTDFGDGELNQTKDDFHHFVASRSSRRGRSAEVMWNFLEEPESSRAAKWYAALTPLFILGTLIVGLMEIITNPVLEGAMAFYLEVSFDCFFAVEIVTRFATSPNRRVFFRNPYNCIDASALATLAFRVWTFIQGGVSTFDAPSSEYNTPSIATVVFWSFVPVMRCLRLLRRFQEFHLLLEAFKMAFEALPVLLYLYFVKMLVFAGFIFAFEPSDNVESLTHSMWLTIVTMTTLGYGDVYPVSTGGRVVVAVLVVTSSLYMAVPLGIIGSCFSEVWQNRQRILLLRSLKSRLTMHGYSAWDIPQLFHHFDADCDGNLAYDEFRTMLEHLSIYFPEAKLINIFDSFDIDGSGAVDDRDLVKALFPLSYHLMYDKDGELKEPPMRRKVSMVKSVLGSA